jgi:AraC-like DNA-binding protein
MGNRSSSLRSRDSFFRRLPHARMLLRPFDRVPGILYFVKDRESRIMAVSPASVPRMGGQTEDDVVGMAPEDYLPNDLAEKYRADDERVMASGLPLVNVVESWFNEHRLRDWIVTDKFPLTDNTGRVIGLIGTLHSFEDRRRHLAHLGPVGKAADFIRERFEEPPSLREVAEAVGYSERQLGRLFHRVFGMSVSRFALHSRVHAAAHALTNADAAITEIALRFGFCDASAFSHAFRAVTGRTPRSYRAGHAAHFTATDGQLGM